MRKLARLLAGCGAVAVLAPSAAVAQTAACGVVGTFVAVLTPTTVFCVNGQVVGAGAPVLNSDQKTYSVNWTSAPNADYTINFSAILNPDPFIIFALGATNLSAAPLSFSFVITTPIAPLQYAGASSTLAGTVTRTDVGPVGGTATVAPVFSNVLRGNALPPVTNLGVDLGNIGCSATTAPGLNPRSANCGFVGAASSSFAPTPFNQLQALVDFSVSAGTPGGGFLGASAGSFTGSLIITAVPEPSDVPLLVVGVASLLLAVRTRRPR